VQVTLVSRSKLSLGSSIDKQEGSRQHLPRSVRFRETPFNLCQISCFEEFQNVYKEMILASWPEHCGNSVDYVVVLSHLDSFMLCIRLTTISSFFRHKDSANDKEESVFGLSIHVKKPTQFFAKHAKL